MLATPLEMASVSQAIANKGVRSPTSIVRDPELAGDYPDVKVTTPEVAEQVKEMMIEVVNSGTGIGGRAAGRPGRRQDRHRRARDGLDDGAAPVPEGDEEAEQDVDAWFTAFAPADEPKIAVAVLVVNADGDGGVIAAPIARAILEAAL